MCEVELDSVMSMPCLDIHAQLTLSTINSLYFIYSELII